MPSRRTEPAETITEPLAGLEMAAGSALEQRDRAETAIGTDADNGAAARRHSGELLERLAENAGAGRREWMTKRDAAAVRVHPRPRKAAEIMLDAGLGADEVLVFESLDVAEHLRRKRLVDFPQRDVVVFEAVPRQQPRNRRHRRHQQTLVENIDRRHLEIDEPRPRQLRRQSLEPRVGGDPDRGGAVG